jgi:hypothetical protein
MAELKGPAQVLPGPSRSLASLIRKPPSKRTATTPGPITAMISADSFGSTIMIPRVFDSKGI